jgi:TrmH family RNA methyltransferase
MNNPALNNIYIILVEPIYAGNVGAVARILNNFCLTNLRIVGSIPHKNDFYLAMHSEHIIDTAEMFDSLAEAVTDLDRVIGFSRRIGKLKPVDLNPWGLGEYFYKAPHLKVGLVFGRETYGLTDAEADLCTMRCHIPANPDFPSLNLAQSVALAAWEIWSYPARSQYIRSTSKRLDCEQTQERVHSLHQSDDPALNDVETDCNNCNNSSAETETDFHTQDIDPQILYHNNMFALKAPAADKAELDKVQAYMLEVLSSIGFFRDFEPVNWESFFTRMLHQLNPSHEMVYRFHRLFNRIHVLFHGKGKGY